MTRRIDPPLHKPVRLELAQLVVNMHRHARKQTVDLIEAQRSAPEVAQGSLFLVPSMIRSAAPTVQLGEQSRRS
jgi:hypothetical protein